MGNQKKKKRRRRRIHPLFYIAVILLFLNLILLGEVLGLRKELAEAVLGETTVSGRTVMIAAAGVSEDGLTAQAEEIYEANEDLLVLVNKEHKIPDNYQTELKLLNNGRFYVAKAMYSDLVQMLDDAGELGYSYYLVSGYRDSEYQQGLVDSDVEMYMKDYGMSYEEALAKTYEQVMPAGYSEHETGFALDITAAGHAVLDETQDSEPSVIWLQENGWKYGFILRYPEDKEDITQISYEPWHFRYVGHEAAQFMYEHDLTLEEFYGYLGDAYNQNIY